MLYRNLSVVVYRRAICGKRFKPVTNNNCRDLVFRHQLLLIGSGLMSILAWHCTCSACTIVFLLTCSHPRRRDSTYAATSHRWQISTGLQRQHCQSPVNVTDNRTTCQRENGTHFPILNNRWWLLTHCNVKSIL